MKISIIVPIYNSEKYLYTCINSICNQTYKDLEIILVDDGSSDGSGEICDKFANDDKRIIVLHKKNEGVSTARNTGIKVATGQFIQFVDSDDYIAPQMCEKLIDGYLHTKADVVICGIETVYGKYRKLKNCVKTTFYSSLNEFSVDFSSLYSEFLLNSPVNKLYKKMLIHKYFENNLSLGEDLLFNIEYLKSCKSIYTIEECLYYYRRGIDGTLTVTDRTDKFDISVMLLEKVLEFCNIYMPNADVSGVYNIFFKNISAILEKIISMPSKDKSYKYRIIYNILQNKHVKNACMQKKKSYLYYDLKNNNYKKIYYKIKIKNNIKKYLKGFSKIKI